MSTQLRRTYVRTSIVCLTLNDRLIRVLQSHLSLFTYNATTCTEHAYNYDDRQVATNHEYSVDHNNCRNLIQSAKRIPFVKGCEREPKTAGTDWGSEGVGEGSHAQAVSDAFDSSSGHPFTLNVSHLEPPSFLPLWPNPSSRLLVRCGAEGETFASARQTCAKLRCRNSSMERNRRDGEAL